MCRVGRRGANRRGLLKTAKARVEIDIHVTLALCRHLALVAEHLDLSAQLSHLLAQHFQLLGELQGGVGGREALQRFFHAGQALRQRLDALALLGNFPARNVIATEKLRMAGKREREQYGAGGRGHDECGAVVALTVHRSPYTGHRSPSKRHQRHRTLRKPPMGSDRRR
jgi:hypothetical protein